MASRNEVEIKRYYATDREVVWSITVDSDATIYLDETQMAMLVAAVLKAKEAGEI